MACISHSPGITIFKEWKGLLKVDLVFFLVREALLLIPFELQIHLPYPV
jgi:hypothetical protein